MTQKQQQALNRLMTSLKVCGANDMTCGEGCPYYAQAEYQSCNTCQVDDMETVLPTLVEEWETLKRNAERLRWKRTNRWLQEGRELFGMDEEKKDGN